jgi:nucleotide-binding universal stress UspA family protein
METIELKQKVALKNILLTSDLSEVSRKAGSYAAAIAKGYGSKIYLVHVLVPGPKTFIPIEPLPTELDYRRAKAEIDMKTLVGEDFLADIPHEVLLERGPIWDVLSALIEQDEIDLLVLGTHGRGGLKKFFLGSVAEELFRMAPCPVLTVGPGVMAESNGAKEFRRILFATDFGPASLHALPYALSLASESSARLMLLHAVPPVPVRDIGPYFYPSTDVVEQQKTARARHIGHLQDLIPPDVDLPFEPEFLVDFDFAPDSIVKIASVIKADLIVMGVNQSASARAAAHLPWAIAHEVVCHAICPVLTVKG